MAGKGRRGMTFGTAFMLVFTAVVLAASLFVIFRLSGGERVDLSRLGRQEIAETLPAGP